MPDRLHPLLHAISGEIAGPGRTVDDQLVELGSVPPRDEGLLFDRHVLRHLLLAGLVDRVHFGRQLVRYVTQPDGTVRAIFVDGTVTSADLLVGADGMGSTVRRQLLPDIPDEQVGVQGAIGRTMMSDRFAGLVPGWTTMVMSGEGRLFLGKMPFRRPPREAAAELAPDVELPDIASYVRWVMLLPTEHAARLAPTGTHGRAAIDALLNLMRGWHPDLRALMEHADSENSGIGPLRILAPVGPWPTGAVTLLGDAAHPTPPGGIGANLAFRDARGLTEVLADVTRCDAELRPALAAHEARMRDYAAAARADAMATLLIFDRTNADA